MARRAEAAFANDLANVDMLQPIDEGVKSGKAPEARNHRSAGVSMLGGLELFVDECTEWLGERDKTAVVAQHRQLVHIYC